MKKFFGKKVVVISAIVLGLLIVASSASADSLKPGFGARFAAGAKQEVKMAKLSEKMDKRFQKTQERFAKQMEQLQEKFRFDDWDDDEGERPEQNHKIHKIRPASTTPMVIHISARGQVSLSGTVESITASTTLVVKSWGGNWNVGTNASTTIISAGHALSDIHIGDRIILRGLMSTTSPFTINAKFVKDLTP